MRVQVGDVRLFFDVQGAKLRPSGAWLDERPTVVIVHTGPGADHTPYKEHVGPVLAAVAQVVYVDLRGHGRSDRGRPDDWCVETWSSDVKALCDRLAIERPIILGAGWGAFVALRVAARWPGHAGKLVLSNPNARFVASRVVAAFDDVGGAEAGEAAHAYFNDPSDQTVGEFLRICFPHVIGPQRAADSLIRPSWNLDVAVHWYRTEAPVIDLRPELPSVRAPVLVLAGDADPQYPSASIDEVIEGLPDVRAARYPHARHSVFRDAPDSFAVIRDFVAR
jgi:pimeloyl-ACP methyl ester carboxylesterase